MSCSVCEPFRRKVPAKKVKKEVKREIKKEVKQEVKKEVEVDEVARKSLKMKAVKQEINKINNQDNNNLMWVDKYKPTSNICF